MTTLRIGSQHRAQRRQVIQRRAFSLVADNSGYVEATAANIAVAAAEVIAASNGRPAMVAPTEILEWTKKNHSGMTPELKALLLFQFEHWTAFGKTPN